MLLINVSIYPFLLDRELITGQRSKSSEVFLTEPVISMVFLTGPWVTLWQPYHKRAHIG